MFILMLIAIYGIIGELSNPGAILPGVVGAIALILVLYMSAILPVNVAGLALIGLAMVLVHHRCLRAHPRRADRRRHCRLLPGRADAVQPRRARLSASRWPTSSRPPLLTAAFFVFVVGAGLRAQFLPVRAGKETMLGQVVPALSRIDADRRQGLRRRRILERRQRRPDRAGPAGRNRRRRWADLEGETEKPH